MEEVTVLRSSREDYGGIMRRVLYWYTISPRVKNALNQDIAPQKSTELPDDALQYVDTAGKQALDSGDAGFEVVNRQQTAGETNTAYRNRILADHNARQLWFIQKQRDDYALTGTAVSG